MDINLFRCIDLGAIQRENVVSLTKLASPHRTSRGASYMLHNHCDSAYGTSVGVAGVGSEIPSIRKTPWIHSGCPKVPVFTITEGGTGTLYTSSSSFFFFFFFFFF
jgi:hypothetical protein